MIRLIIRQDDCGMAVNVGGAVFTRFYTVDADLPEVERLLLADNGSYSQTQVVGVEVLSADAPASPTPAEAMGRAPSPAE